MEQGAVKRQGRGRPRIRPDRVAGDKGYSSPTVRRYLKERRIGAAIPTKSDEAPDSTFDRVAYRERNFVERLINERVALKGREPGGTLPIRGDRERLERAAAILKALVEGRR